MENVMNDTSTKQKVRDAILAIHDAENSVSNTCTHTFNFKGRKSSNIASKIIGKIAEKNSVVCDPFFGSNAFGLAAAENDIKFIGCDIDNYTFDVVKVLFTKIDFAKLLDYFKTIKENCRSEIMELYATECCGIKNYISKLHFDPEGENGFSQPEYYNPTPHRDIVNNETIVMVSECPKCHSKKKVFQIIDEQKIKECEKLEVSDFPSHRLIENSRINITSSSGANKYNRNFTHRAQYGLLLLQKEILKLPASKERDLLEHCLVASLTLARICQYGSGSEYIYQVMRKQAQEKNVWEIFESKVQAFCQFKNEYSKQQYDTISDINGKMYLENENYEDFLKKFAGAIDIIYTDPPYTDQVAYLERSQLYRDWLNIFYYKNRFGLTEQMLNDEIVVTNAPSRINKSGLIQYYHDLDKMFDSFNKALKPKGLIVMHIKLGAKKYISVFAEYVKYARKNGFEIVDKYCIDKKDPTLRKQAARKNTLANELIVFFEKLDPDEAYWYVGDEDIGFRIIKFLYNQIKKSDAAGIMLTESVILVINYLNRTFGIEKTDDVILKVESIIRKNFHVLENSLVCINPSKLYLDVEDNTALFTKLYDVVPVIIRSFDKDKGFTLEDLYSEIIVRLFNGNSATLTQIVESSDHEQQIKTLLAQYCNVDDSQKYTMRIYKNQKTTEESIELSTLNGSEFEKLTAELLEKKGFFDIAITGQAGDRGVDIIAKKVTDGVEEKYLVQCKRWLSNVSGTPIQRLHSMMIQLNIPHAICITTSDYTPDAKKESFSTGVEIINGKELLEQLAIYFPGKYYMVNYDNK